MLLKNEFLKQVPFVSVKLCVLSKYFPYMLWGSVCVCVDVLSSTDSMFAIQKVSLIFSSALSYQNY